MAKLTRLARTALLGACAAATTVGPALVLAGGQAGTTLAQPCAGGVDITVLQEGVPVTTNCGPQQVPGTDGGAPSQEILSWCNGIPGCLSDALYGPGNVQVPHRDTTVRQSQ